MCYLLGEHYRGIVTAMTKWYNPQQYWGTVALLTGLHNLLFVAAQITCTSFTIQPAL